LMSVNTLIAPEAVTPARADWATPRMETSVAASVIVRRRP